jgi:hypothetical protein
VPDPSEQIPTVEPTQAAIEENAKDMGIGGQPPQETVPETPAPAYKMQGLGIGDEVTAGGWQNRGAWSQQPPAQSASRIDEFNDKGHSALHQQKAQRDMNAEELEAEKLRLMEEYKAEFARQAQSRELDHGIDID